MPGALAVETRDLKLYYGQMLALKGISAGFHVNAITALIGPSGCGKSTFLRTLNRMNDLIEGVRVEGQVLIHGENVYGPNTDLSLLRKHVGMVFQRPTAFPISIYENVAVAPRVHGITRRDEVNAIVERSLRAVGLWDDVKDKLKKPGLSLSLGQQQQLSIARVLATGPEIILLDEPCSALDPVSTLRIEELMRELQEKYHIVIVTHNMQQAARASDYTLFMLSGDVIEYGPTEEVFTSPRDKRTEDYVSGKLG
ncbi:MAG: phosphate ABC transporter ATP-binding protein PstB [Actinobacteria bacterium]|nr:phosphate ABC transporter ATP-binding protein PstB [Actinomycetota bacterium]